MLLIFETMNKNKFKLNLAEKLDEVGRVRGVRVVGTFKETLRMSEYFVDRFPQSHD